MNRLTISWALGAVAVALLSGCSSDEPPQTGTAAPATSSLSVAPSSASGDGPAASASAAAKGGGTALCEKVTAAKVALNEDLKRVVAPGGKVPPAEGKKLMTGLAATLSDLAASGDGELADALEGLSAEAAKAAGAADPVQAALSPAFDAAGQKVDKACAKP
ncbi:hypothetical protein AB0C12_00020 [Actinoplanes sp. NPDC048967]|uniref:hypothetical protein n=1 Tax=Actinoplanes sp. NPDC048967 TaxID=3155269 RepID=UPI0033BFF56D